MSRPDVDLGCGCLQALTKTMFLWLQMCLLLANLNLILWYSASQISDQESFLSSLSSHLIHAPCCRIPTWSIPPPLRLAPPPGQGGICPCLGPYHSRLEVWLPAQIQALNLPNSPDLSKVVSQVSSSLVVAQIAAVSLRLQSKTLTGLLTGFSVMDGITVPSN